MFLVVHHCLYATISGLETSHPQRGQSVESYGQNTMTVYHIPSEMFSFLTPFSPSFLKEQPISLITVLDLEKWQWIEADGVVTVLLALGLADTLESYPINVAQQCRMFSTQYECISPYGSDYSATSREWNRTKLTISGVSLLHYQRKERHCTGTMTQNIGLVVRKIPGLQCWNDMLQRSPIGFSDTASVLAISAIVINSEILSYKLVFDC